MKWLVQLLAVVTVGVASVIGAQILLKKLYHGLGTSYCVVQDRKVLLH